MPLVAFLLMSPAQLHQRRETRCPARNDGGSSGTGLAVCSVQLCSADLSLNTFRIFCRRLQSCGGQGRHIRGEIVGIISQFEARRTQSLLPFGLPLYRRCLDTCDMSNVKRKLTIFENNFRLAVNYAPLGKNCRPNYHPCSAHIPQVPRQR